MRAIIFANGTINHPQQALNAIHPDDLLIAADGGARNCLEIGLTPAVVIGDLDSLSSAELRILEAHGSRIEIYPRDKDQTDLELALRYAVEQGFDEILLLGLLGGRLDQTLANLLLLALPDWNEVRLSTQEGPDTAHFVRDGDSITITGQIGDIVSLIPLSPEVSGVSLRGVRWPLKEAVLRFGSTLGISNELEAPEALVRIGQGRLLIVHRRMDLGI